MSERQTAGQSFALEIIDPFEYFANLPFYININRKLVDAASLKEGQRILDVASGPGNISKLISEKIGESGWITAVDISQKALLAARRNLEGIRTKIDLIRARAEDIGKFFIEGQLGKFDAVVAGNSVHNFSNKGDFFEGVSKLLKRKGSLVLNSAFFDGATPQEESRFYRLWMVIANKLAREVEGEGKNPANRAGARDLLKPIEYKEALETYGFTVRSQTFEEVDMAEEDFVAISHDDEFAQGALSKYSLETAKRVLIEGVKRAFDQLQLSTSRRIWMQVVAEKV